MLQAVTKAVPPVQIERDSSSPATVSAELSEGLADLSSLAESHPEYTEAIRICNLLYAKINILTGPCMKAADWARLSRMMWLGRTLQTAMQYCPGSAKSNYMHCSGAADVNGSSMLKKYVLQKKGDHCVYSGSHLQILPMTSLKDIPSNSSCWVSSEVEDA